MADLNSKYADRMKAILRELSGGIIQKGAKTLGVNALKKSMPIALGMMGAAMSYATGSSGVMEAVGVGSALNKGSEEFFESSQGTLENGAKESLDEDLGKDENVKRSRGHKQGPMCKTVLNYIFTNKDWLVVH